MCTRHTYGREQSREIKLIKEQICAIETAIRTNRNYSHCDIMKSSARLVFHELTLMLKRDRLQCDYAVKAWF